MFYSHDKAIMQDREFGYDIIFNNLLLFWFIASLIYKIFLVHNHIIEMLFVNICILIIAIILAVIITIKITELNIFNPYQFLIFGGSLIMFTLCDFLPLKK